MDGVQRVRDLRQFAPGVRATITYVDDPQYFQFADGVKVFGGNTLVIEVNGNILKLFFLLLSQNQVSFSSWRHSLSTAVSGI